MPDLGEVEAVNAEQAHRRIEEIARLARVLRELPESEDQTRAECERRIAALKSRLPNY